MLKPDFIGPTDPLQLLREFGAMGVTQVIVLDLARVGSGEGVDVDFLKKVKDELGMDIYVGGGVRGIGDLINLKTLGISGALIATALHTGKISITELKQEDFL